MGRSQLIRQNKYPYHITTRSNNKEWFELSLEVVWEIIRRLFIKLNSEFKIELNAFVLMSNHYHMLIKTPDSNIDEIMYFFNRNLSMELRKRTLRINRMFGGRYKRTIVTSDKYLAIVYKYIYRNPIKAGLVGRAHEYLYSTLFYEVNKKSFGVPICSDIGLSSSFLNWVEEPFSIDQVDSIKRGLSHQNFLIKGAGPRKSPVFCAPV